MAKTIWLLVISLWLSVLAGCSSTEFWNAAEGVKVEKEFKVNAPELNYEFTVKVKIEHNALYLTVAGFEVEPIYLREIFSEKDAENMECEIVNNELKITAGEKEVYSLKVVK